MNFEILKFGNAFEGCGYLPAKSQGVGHRFHEPVREMVF